MEDNIKILENRVELLEQTVLQLLKDVEVLTNKKPRQSVITSGAPKHVQEFIAKRKREVESDGR